MDDPNQGRRPPVLNWAQACDLMGCSRAHFYRLLQRGLIPKVATRRGGGARVSASDCLAYLTRRAANRFNRGQ